MKLLVFLSFFLLNCSTVESTHEQNLIFQKDQAGRINKNNFKNSKKVRLPNKIKQKQIKIKNKVKI